MPFNRFWNGGPDALNIEAIVLPLTMAPTEAEQKCDGACERQGPDGKPMFRHSYCEENSRRIQAIVQTRRAHPLGVPNRDSIVHRDGKPFIRVPDHFCKRELLGRDTDGKPIWGKAIPEFRPWTPGSITLSLLEHGFFVIGPGEYVDVPTDVSVSSIKDVCPHLLTDEEYRAKQPEPAKAKR